MSDINASIQPESGAQQGAEVPSALNPEAGTAAMGEPLTSTTPSAVDSQSSTVAQSSSSEPTIEAIQPSALPSSGNPQPALIPVAGEAGNVDAQPTAVGQEAAGNSSGAAIGTAANAGGDTTIAAQAQFAAATLPTALVEAAPDVSGSVVTPIDGTAPATEAEKSHPVHNVLVRIELLAENLPNEFMNMLKHLVVEGRDELRKIL